MIGRCEQLLLEQRGYSEVKKLPRNLPGIEKSKETHHGLVTCIVGESALLH